MVTSEVGSSMRTQLLLSFSSRVVEVQEEGEEEEVQEVRVITRVP